ncbi:MAG TPA: hypothetical protein VGL19_07725 [Polyangiaceae bacterium]|jgi:hypothetical protein
MSLRFPLSLPLLPAVIAGLLVFASARPAQASSGTAIGVDLDYTNGIKEPFVGSGTGFNVRLGYKLDLLLLQLTPEVGGAYHTFSGDAGAKFSQGIAGARIAFGKILEPGAYAHVGYGHVGVDGGGGRSGATIDGGLTLDLTILPLIDLGVHAGYNGLLASGSNNAFDTYVLGVHGALVF